MPIQNADISRIFNRIADLLEIQGANPFRIRAYRNAARTLDTQSKSVADRLESGEDLSELPAVGADLAEKIEEIVTTGELEMLNQLEEEVPGELPELLRIDQLGPKKVAALYRELNIASLTELAAAADEGKIRALDGFGEKTEQKIRNEIERLREAGQRVKLADAEKRVAPLLAYLEDCKGVKRVTLAGSYRRRKETVGDLDILVTSTEDSRVMERFVAYEDVVETLAQGQAKSSVRLRGGLQVDLRLVPEASYGAALYYFTGSRAHNIALRKIAIDQGMKLNEYGVFRKENADTPVVGETEEELLAEFDLSFIPPELREDNGEIEAAREGRLPTLIELDDIRGDLHTHTKATDGRASLEEMVEAARALGYSYLAITEHSQAVSVANGFNRKRLEQQIDEIDELTDQYSGFRILKGIEVDIRKDGSLDLPDAVLEKLDFSICSVHSHFNLSREKQTERIIRALDNPLCTILGHPSGRLINERPAYQVDMEKILQAAKQRNCIMELNAHPDRLDLNDQHCRLAKELGVKLAISTDAHSTEGLKNMCYGIYQARRGWLEKADVVNTRRVAELSKLFAR